MNGSTRGLGIVALVLASGCFDTEDTQVPASEVELFPAEDFAVDCNQHDYTELLASSPSPDRIDVEHRGLDFELCGTWSAEATVDGDTITVEYLSAEDTTADCSCNWTFTYWLPVGRSGTFTVEAEGDTVTVTVP